MEATQLRRFAVVFATTHGQAGKTASRIVEDFTANGHLVDHFKADDPDPRVDSIAWWSDLDGIVLVGSIHVGLYQSALRRFIERHRSKIESTRNALVSVSLTATKTDPQSQRTLQEYEETLFEQTGWRPHRVVHVKGAVVYRRYGFWLRWFVRWFVGQSVGATDSKRDHEFTDWEAVDAFAERFPSSIRGLVEASGVD